MLIQVQNMENRATSQTGTTSGTGIKQVPTDVYFLIVRQTIQSFGCANKTVFRQLICTRDATQQIRKDAA